MKFFNKYLFISFIFAIVFISISVLLKMEFESFALYEANQKLDRVLTNQKALHTYVENELKPVIYKLKTEKKLYKEFFDPKILSFTYIARSIYEIENKIYADHDKPGLYYKLAANNPRNDLNQATTFEKKLLKKFNHDKTIKEYKEILEYKNQKHLFFSKPVTANKQSCLKCHSEPEYAPQELRNMYGDVKGFHETLGEIRAILSIKIPLSSELGDAKEYYTKLLILIFCLLFFVYLIIILLLRKLDKKNDALYEISTMDQLTQIKNRRVFDQDMYTSVIQAKREKQSLYLMMLDIDFFKKINDNYGHQVGDNVLIEIANIIKESTREYDDVYRIGGEEFIMILKNVEKEEIFLLAQRIREKVESHYESDKKITISIGICQFSDEDDVNTLYKKVDDALYMAKENGRNRVFEFTR